MTKNEKDFSWRDLAIPLDSQRMAVLSHLSCMLENPAAHCKVAQDFLSALLATCEVQLAERVKDLAAQMENTDDIAKKKDSESEWRRLTFQFDAHRLAALTYLRCMIDDPESYREQALRFLAEPPVGGNVVLAERIKALNIKQVTNN